MNDEHWAGYLFTGGPMALEVRQGTGGSYGDAKWNNMGCIFRGATGFVRETPSY
jgi:hypothetical protein